MRIIEPAPGTLGIDTVNTDYTYALWDDSPAVNYALGAVARWPLDQAMPQYDYRAKLAHTSAVGLEPTNTLYWTLVGRAATTTTTTYDIGSLRESNYPAWAAGVEVPAGSVLYDNRNHHDYIASVLISAANNTTPPSEAIVSTDPIVASRWVDAGSSNAWAPFDGLTNTYLVGRTANDNTMANVYITFDTVITGKSLDCIYFSGINGVDDITVVIESVNLTSDVVAPLTPWTGFTDLDKTMASGGMELDKYGQVRRSVIMKFTKTVGGVTSYVSIPAGYTVKAAVTLSRLGTSGVVRCSVMGLGAEFEIAHTEWGVESALMDFSKIQRDETYGTVEFIKRGNANRVTATCYIDSELASGDVVQSILRKFSGIPVLIDFNNSAANVIYDRLIVYGFYTSVRTVINADTYGVLSMEVEGLTS